jgi:membrane carboxypeptidase/penicillin-binding protein
VPANAAYLITNVLSDDRARYSMFGANSPLNLAGRPAAVKSGSSDNTRDAWAIGYTPQLVTGVWVGNANNAPMPGATSTYTAAPIWAAFMTAALEGQRAIDFPVPEGIQFVDVCVTTGQAPTRDCPGVVREPFLTGRLPSGAQPRATQPPARETFVPGGLVTPTPPRRTGTPPPRETFVPGGLLTPTPRTSGTPTPRVTRTPESDERPRGRGNGNGGQDD